MKVNRKQLQEGLARLQGGLAGKCGGGQVMEQSDCFVFQQDRIYTFNDELAVSLPYECGEMTGAVPAKELLAVVAKMTDEELDASVEDNQLIFKGKRSKAGIRLESEIRLPLDSIRKAGKFIAIPDGLMAAIGRSSEHAAKASSKPELANVHVDGNLVEACDGFQLIRCMLEVPAKSLLPSMLIPARFVRDILTASPVKFSFTKDSEWIHFESEDGLRVSARTSDGEYPNLNPLLEPDGEGVAVEFPTSINDSIERAEIFAKRDLSQEVQLEVVCKDGTMVVRSQNDRGWAEEKVRTRFKGQASFRVHPVLFKMILNKTTSVTMYREKLVVEGTEDATTYVVSLIADEG